MIIDFNTAGKGGLGRPVLPRWKTGPLRAQYATDRRHGLLVALRL
jgi:hypothetical protein